MPENLDLPPEVRAVQADMLRHLDFRVTCDLCPNPAGFAALRICCPTPVVWCDTHVTEQLAELAGANLGGYGQVCPVCMCVFCPPVRAGHMFEHREELITGGTA